MNFDLLGPEFFWTIQIAGGATYAAAGITAFLLFRLLLSLVSATPLDLLKRRAAVFAVIGLPSVPPLIAYQYDLIYFVGSFMLLAKVLLAWTDAFAALAIGVSLQQVLSRRSRVPNILALPFVASICVPVCLILAELAPTYFTFPLPSACEPRPYPFFSTCGYFRYEGFYALGALFILVIVCGLLLSPNSNIIRGYAWLTGVSPYQPTAAPKNEDGPRLDRLPARALVSELDDLEKQMIKHALRSKRQEFEL
ncbi:MAG TPA: hypothetical protein VKW08_16940 [Xanthobacteraceae bacterium]|jgi:hypothetical protein|nr:hypothetical protein [Xanthobacteraceae bacterium]